MSVNEVKNFTKRWTKKNLKGLNKEARAELLYSSSYSISKFYFEKAWKQENKPLMGAVLEAFKDEKLFKTLKFMNKNKDLDLPIDLGLIPIMVSALSTLEDEEYQEAYIKLVRKLLKGRVKEVTKKVNIDKDVLYDLLVIYPTHELVKPQFCGHYADRMLQKLYILSKEDEIALEPKDFKKLFKALFGKEELSYIAISALLQRKETINGFTQTQLKLWNSVTKFALDVLEALPKNELEKRLQFYYGKVKVNPNMARRIELNSLGEDYPKITKMIHKMTKPKKENK